ncbi:MAG TPA: hypothetical protein ENI48_08535 [Thioploca sp.]|nr:hypothetical protein [Thioploca sp.]
MTIVTKILAGSLIFCLMSSVDATSTIPIFRVDAKGKTGAEIGAALGKAVKEQFPDIGKKYDSYLASFVDQNTFNSWVQKRVNFVKPNIDQAYQDEVNAIVSNWGIVGIDQVGDGYLSLNEFWLLQLIPDIGRRTNCSGFGVFGNVSALKAPIVGRNMDWRTTEALRSIQAITVYEYEKITFVNIGFAGYVGVISGFNSDGLFVAHLDSPLGKRYPEPIGDHAIVFDLRKVLEKTTKISAAAISLSKQQYGFSHNILMADTKDVEVLEQPQGQKAHLRNATSPLRIEMSWGKPNQIAVVNCFVLRNSPLNCISSIDRFRWHRFRTLAKFNSTDNQAHVKDVIKIMFDKVNPYQEIFNQNTVQSIVFTPKDKRLHLYTVPISGIHSAHPVMYEIPNLLPVSPVQETWISDTIMYVIAFLILGSVLFISFGNNDYSKKRG